MRVKDVGEFGLIERLRHALPEAIRGDARGMVGIGDDCAVWTAGSRRQVITTDTLIEGRHFRLDWTDWTSLGWKSLAVNLSDIASMGARPTIAVITLGLTGDERVDDLVDLYRGIAELAEPHEVVIAGGDIVRTTGPLVISVTVIGETDAPLLRSGAQVGDAICVSGTLGASGAGLELLLNPDLHPTSATRDLLVRAHHRPQPRMALGRLLVEYGATSCMDLSDGLLGDLPKILVASNVGAMVSEAAIPVLPAVRALFPDRWSELALRAGEDYELLWTMPADRADALGEAASGIGATVTCIGTLTAASGEIILQSVDGTSTQVASGAFDHFGD